MYTARIVADSVNTSGNRLTTFYLMYPRIIHAEMLRHRTMSRSVSSSRAIPAKRMIEQVRENPYIPHEWRMNEPGMQGWSIASDDVSETAKNKWLYAMYDALDAAYTLAELNIHKQHINRLLEPFSWIEEVVTATEWMNFFVLRTASDADPTIQVIAKMMMGAYEESVPQLIQPGQWHLPYTDSERCHVSIRCKISAARCARVSYQLRNGQRSDVDSDIALFDRLVEPQHWSPLEHPALALDKPERIGNFVGWKQLRKFYDNESGGDYRLIA